MRVVNLIVLLHYSLVKYLTCEPKIEVNVTLCVPHSAKRLDHKL